MKFANLLPLIVALTIAACSPATTEETPTVEPTAESDQPTAEPTETEEPATPEATPELPETPDVEPTDTEAYPGPSGAEDSLSGTQWRLASFETAGEETPVAEGTTVTLQFQAGGQAVGSGGCNSYGTEYEVQGSTISFGDVISTMMACEDEAIMVQENRFYTALQSAGEFEMTADGLTIRYDDGQSALNFVPSAADATATETPSAYPEN